MGAAQTDAGGGVQRLRVEDLEPFIWQTAHSWAEINVADIDIVQALVYDTIQLSNLWLKEEAVADGSDQ